MPGRTAAYAVIVDSDAMAWTIAGALRLVGDVDQHRVGRAEARIESRRGDGAAQEDRGADQQQRRGEDLDADQRVARAAGPRVLHHFAAQRPHAARSASPAAPASTRKTRWRPPPRRPGTAPRANPQRARSRLMSPRSTACVRRPSRPGPERDPRDRRSRRRPRPAPAACFRSSADGRCGAATRRATGESPISRCRATPRASNRLATLAQPISRISPKAKNSGVKSAMASKGCGSVPRRGISTMLIGRPIGGVGRRFESHAAICARALSIDTPGLRRPMMLDADGVFAAAIVGLEVARARQRRPEVRCVDLETAEPRRHHADDLERLAA